MSETFILGFELVKQCRAEAMPAAHLNRWHPSLIFFDHPDNRGLRKTALSHLFVPSKFE